MILSALQNSMLLMKSLEFGELIVDSFAEWGENLKLGMLCKNYMSAKQNSSFPSVFYSLHCNQIELLVLSSC